MNVWHDIDARRITPQSFLAFIEITSGSSMKYELDKESGLRILDRALYTSTHYPHNYGFIPKTLADDGDPLDVLVLCHQKIDAGVIVPCYPIGVLVMTDGGEMDEKIIAVPFGEPALNTTTEIEQIPAHIANEMSHFFSVYKELEGKTTAVQRVAGKAEAEKIIGDCITMYRAKFNEE